MTKVVVICTACGVAADYDPPDGSHPFGVWHWRQPCKHCGANEWAAHDMDRDRQTGKLRQPNLEG